METTKREKITIASQLPIFTGFYDTDFSAVEDNFIDDYNEGNGVCYGYDDFEWGNFEYKREISEGCAEWVRETLKSLGFNIDMDFTNIYSPREYNYRNDEIDVNYSFNKTTFKKIVKYIKDNSEGFDAYLKERYLSYDGFISFYPDNSEEWAELINLDRMAKDNIILVTLLGFILENEEYGLNDMIDEVYHIEIQGVLIESQINDLVGNTLNTALSEYKRIKEIDLFVSDLEVFTMIENDPEKIRFTKSGDLINPLELRKFVDPNQLELF